MNRVAFLVATIAALMLAACTPKAGISGAAMMRVEVEVYKGPVGESADIQRGELAAILGEAVKSSLAIRDQAITLANTSDLGCKDPAHAKRAGADCPALYQVIASAGEVAAEICAIPNDGSPGGLYEVPVWTYRNDGTVQLGRACESVSATLSNRSKPPITEYFSLGYKALQRASSVATIMQTKARRAADGNIGYVPRDQRVRLLSSSLDYMFTEFAKSISSRVLTFDILARKCATESKEKFPVRTNDSPDDRPDSVSNNWTPNQRNYYYTCLDNSGDLTSKLPTSAYLRDVEPTRYLEAFDWFNADLNSFGTGANLRRNRERSIKALNNGLYWEKVNEVYASGQGEVSMAFVKDELGNWNLKSYTNDPSKLLSAYRQGANALIKAAVDTARKVSGDPTALANGSGMLDLAERFATGRPTGAANIGGLGMATLHDRTKARLVALKAHVTARVAELGAADGLTGTIKAADDAVTTAAQTSSDAQTALATAVTAEANARAALENCGETCPTAREGFTTTNTQLQAARTTATAAISEFRSKQDALAVLKAERAQLGGAAAEQALQILAEHQHDLLTLQQTVVSESSTPQSPAPDK